MRRTSCIVLLSCLLFVFVQIAQGDILSNGDFEASPFDTGWVNIAGDTGLATSHAGLVAGSIKATQINANGNDLGQLLGPVGSEWTVDFYAAIPDPSTYSGANRSFNLLLSDNSDPAGITAFTWTVNMRVGTGGAIQMYNGAWVTIGSGNEITYSIDANGDGDFSDAGDTLNVQHIQIDGHNWGTASSAYDVYVNGSAVATDLTLFQNKTPDTALTSLYFRSGFGLVAGQTYVVDDVVVSDDTPGVVITETGGTTGVYEENTTQDTFTVLLRKSPSDTVTISLSDTSSPNQVTIQPVQLQFDAGNYSTAQTVTVTAIDDEVAEAYQHTTQISVSVASGDSSYNGLSVSPVTVTIVDNDSEPSVYPQFSGIYPHLAVSNGTTSECGIGAVVPWAGSLWYMTYIAHAPGGSSDKLYQLSPDLNVTVRPESVGGTPANRMIHTESNQLAIASYLIDDQANVRAIPLSTMPGRMTGNARHLTDPANKLYFATMEEGFYEVDVNTLAVTTLQPDVQYRGTAMIDGFHGKGCYSGQGRLVYSNNGYLGYDFGTNNGHGGALAEWDGTGAFTSSWVTIDREKYTDVTGPGGIYGNASTDDPIWAIGWDEKSVLLNVCDNGGQWKRYRLPKASFTQDADHGWYTEWPRIRETEQGRYIMNHHCMLYEFPGTFSHDNVAGIRPIATHLKMFVDYTQWGDQLVCACNDASYFSSSQNTLLGRNQSNLWFTTVDGLYDLGRPLGWGSLWIREAVSANQPSEPYLFSDFDKRVVHLAHDKASDVHFTLELDTNGDDTWTTYTSIVVPASGYKYFRIPSDIQAEWIRVKTNTNINAATVCFHYYDTDQALDPTMFTSVAKAGQADAYSQGLLRPRSSSDLKLQFAADILDETGAVVDTGYYEIGEDMQLTSINSPSTESWLRTNSATQQEFQVDNASVIMTDNRTGVAYRLPKANVAYGSATASGWPRGIREVVTERDLMNIHGTFYELPRDHSGDLRKIRPITTHNRMIYDYCSWRGMLVLAGNLTGDELDAHYIKSNDGKVGLWFGNVDDLHKMGIPRGYGGPWKDSSVQANIASDPYLMLGYDKKVLQLSHNLQQDVQMTVEVDFLADNTWHTYETITVPAGQTIEHVFPEGYSAHWVRVKADKACAATAWFEYNPVYDGKNGLYDFAVMARNWITVGCGYCEGADLDNNGTVDMNDLLVFVGNWIAIAE